MGKAPMPDDTITLGLRSHMQSQGIASFRALAEKADIPIGQLQQVRRGQVSRLRLEGLQKLAMALGIDLADLLALGGVPLGREIALLPGSDGAQVAALRAECDRLQQQLLCQAAELRQTFQQESLYQLEPWMKNWPRVVHAIGTDQPDLAATKVLPLVKPVERLLQSWGVETIGSVGDRVLYTPQQHQLVRGAAQPGESVVIVRPGYRQGDRLLHRAEVQALAPPP